MSYNTCIASFEAQDSWPHTHTCKCVLLMALTVL